MMLRNMAASYLWHRSSVQSVGGWSQSTAVPALVARLQAAPQPPEPILLHILRALVNFAATGAPPRVTQRDLLTPLTSLNCPFLLSDLCQMCCAAMSLQQRGCVCGQWKGQHFCAFSFAFGNCIC